MRAKRNKYPESENYYPFRKWYQSCDLLHAWVLSPSSWDGGEVILRNTLKKKNPNKAPSPLWSYRSVIVGCWRSFTNSICCSPAGDVHNEREKKVKCPWHPQAASSWCWGMICLGFASLGPEWVFQSTTLLSQVSKGLMDISDPGGIASAHSASVSLFENADFLIFFFSF